GRVAALLVLGEAGDADGARGDRRSQVGQPLVGAGDLPETGECLADDAVAAAAHDVRAAYEPSPRACLLADPPDLPAEQPGLAAHVGELGVGERPLRIALGELD